MAKSRMSREERRKKLHGLRKASKDAFQDKDRSAVEPPAPDEPLQKEAPVQDRQPASPPPLPKPEPAAEPSHDIDSLRNLDDANLLAAARQECGKKGVRTTQQLFQNPGLSDFLQVLGERDLLGKVFSTPPPIIRSRDDKATRIELPPPQIHPLADALGQKAAPPERKTVKPPRRRSTPPPSIFEDPGIELGNISSPPSMPFDPTSAVEVVELEDKASEIMRFKEEIMNEPDSGEKYERGIGKYKKEKNAFDERFGNRVDAIYQSAQRKDPAKDELEPEERVALALIALDEYLEPLAKIYSEMKRLPLLNNQNGRKVEERVVIEPADSSEGATPMELPRKNGPSKEEMQEPEVPSQVTVRPSQPPQQEKEEGLLKRLFSNPWTYAIVSFGGMSVTAHLTDAFTVMAATADRMWNLFNLPQINFWEHLDKAVWYGSWLIAIGIGTSWHKSSVRKVIRRKWRIEFLDEAEKRSIKLVIAKLKASADFSRGTSGKIEPQIQINDIQRGLIDDEGYRTAMFIVYANSSLWKDAMDEVGLHRKVKDKFPELMANMQGRFPDTLHRAEELTGVVSKGTGPTML